VQIEKEEGPNSESATMKANIKAGLVEAGEVLVPGDHLLGAGALVKPHAAPGTAAKHLVASQLAALHSGAASGSKPASLASFRSGPKGSLTGKGATGSVAGSVPHTVTSSLTKTQSIAGQSATSTAIVGRLVRLEQELARERARREGAEREMKALLDAAATQAGQPS
jgi:hypothetical protein